MRTAEHAPAKPRPRHVFRRGLETVEAALTIGEYLGSIGAEYKPQGMRLIAHCPNPAHDDKTPSFHAWPEGGTWYCFGACARGGDLLDLFMMVEGWPNDAYGEALAALADRFGVELPRRPRSWHRRQERQRPVREKIRAARVEVLRRRLFRICMLPLIKATTPDQREFREEVTRAWEDFRGVPVEALLGNYDHLGGI